VETNVGTKSTDSGNNVETNVGTKSTDSGNNVETNVGTKSTDSGSAIVNKIYYYVQNLSGIQLKLMGYIWDIKFQENKKYYVYLNTKAAALESGIGIDKLRISLRRIESKNIIKRESGVMGRNGFSIFNIPHDVIKYYEQCHLPNGGEKKDSPLIYNSNTTNTINKYSGNTKEQKPTTPQKDQLIELIKQQNDKIVEFQKQFLQQAPQIQPETKKVTVTEATETNTLESDNDNWTDLDFSSLTQFGFTKRHVTQIKNFNKSLDADNQLTVDSVQESIEHYAWALQNRLEEMASYAPDNNRLRGLIGVLKKGGNWTEANYKSPEDLAFEASLKAKEERLLKLKEQKERVFNIEFELWRESLTATELTDIEEKGELQGKMPPSAFKNKGDNKHYVAALKTYFKNNVYGGQ
ncbi:hypothetical protein, partial [Cysteiniphilum halobium]|uniref:hypothetical protein n=1 Tax=Cysteiniphilum halobium TaxID=2219059 RepID=UPI003F867875